jgi:ABC-type uncharacterized transport system substrate-binding protein
MRRREFIAGLAVAALPVAARAQQGGRMRRVGVLMANAADDPESTRRIVAFGQDLQELGWIESRNLRIDVRWAGGNAELYRKYATELVALAPEVILAYGGSIVAALQQASRSVPIVFVEVTDPVAFGLVASLARPGGNATGFMGFDYSFSAKWVERGLIVPALSQGSVHRDLIISLAARHRLPAVYPYRYFASGGGLISYGIDPSFQYRLAAGYVDRILKGEKPADLPVQAPTKYEMVINLTTAKALGLTIPETLLATADEVIQ